MGSHTLGNGDGCNTCWVVGVVVGGNGDGGVLSYAMVCAMVCLSDDLIYSNILALFLVVFLCSSFGLLWYIEVCSQALRAPSIAFSEGPRKIDEGWSVEEL